MSDLGDKPATRIFGLAGWSGSGKTTLMVALLNHLCGLGLTLSSLKHAHHHFDVDQPGKDSFRHRAAGAMEVMVASGNRWALMHELRGAPEPDMATLLSHMTPVDLVLIEGFKTHPHPKLEIHRPSLGQPFLAPNDPHIVAVASDRPLTGLDVPLLDLADIPAIANFIIQHCDLKPRIRGAA
ncbi:MAG: molybdopterin-guanine dinucleotide biosynthesis protein B [Alphaproteobacteria bacterium]